MDLLNGKRFELKLDEYKNATQPMEQNFIRSALFKMIDDYADNKVKEFSSKQDVERSALELRKRRGDEDGGHDPCYG